MRKIDYSILLPCHLLFLFCLASAPARGQHLSFSNWNIESGLSQNSVYSIAQDPYGFIWIGTGKGLNRFDGKEFLQYALSNDLRYAVGDNDVDALLAEDDRIWVGLQSGLLAYNIGSGNFDKAVLPDGSPVRSINCLYRDLSNRIWAGTNNGLYLLANPAQLEFKKFDLGDSADPLLHKRIRTLFDDGKDNLWVGSNQGLIRIHRPADQPSWNIYTYDAGDPRSLSSNMITSITADKFNHLWIGTQSRGINRFDPATGFSTRFHSGSTVLPLINNNIRVLRTDSSGNIWVGTQEGLSRIDPAAMTIRHFQNDPLDKNSLSQNSVHSIFIDHNQFIWVGTFFGGINLINPFPSDFRIWQNNGASTGLSNNVVSSMARDASGRLWVGTEGGGVNCFNPQTGSFRYYNENNSAIGSNLIKTIFRDADDHIWIGTHAGGLNLYENGDFKKYFYHPENPSFLISEISTIAEDKAQNLWLGLQGGIQQVQVYQRNGTSLQDISDRYDLRALKGKNIKKILSDSRDNVWIGSSKGLFIVPAGRYTAFEVNAASGSLSEQITCIQEDSRGNIWFGVEHGGINKYSPETRKIYSHHFRMRSRENDVFGILEDDNGFLWIGTGNGLIKMNPFTALYQSYTTVDGLPSNAFNYNAYYKDDQGSFYFGGFQGMISFDPASFFTNTIKSDIVFTTLKTLNQSVGIPINRTQQLKLSHNQNVFTIEFALLNFIKPEKNRYAYRLRGFDQQWNFTDKPAATYMNLKPGNYTLMIRGANNDGIWSTARELTLVILPPFWKTWWAYLIYIILIVTIGFFILRYFYLQALLKKEDALHQNKLDFFTNVTHEIRTHLTLIMAPVDKMIQDRAQDKYLQQQFQTIKENADDLLQLSDELMDFRKVETQHLKLQIAPQDIVRFVKEIYEHFTELSLARNMQISFTHDMASCNLYFDKIQLEKVFYNLISNAFKFTPDGGRIQVHIADSHPYIKVSVTDNGRGIAPEYKDKLFNNFFQVNDTGSQNKGYGIGLALSSKIAALHGARIEVDSKIVTEEPLERQTIFAVFLQQGNHHFGSLSQIEPRVIVSEPRNPAVAIPTTPIRTEPDFLESYMNEKKLSVLVVDDNPDIRKTIHDILASKYNVTNREDASQGWDFAVEHIPDFIISDVMMPEEDGFSFCNRLKSDLRTCHIPVMLLTAKSTQQDQIDGLGRGADIYLTKPFNRTILELNIRNLLATRERIREAVSGYIQKDILSAPDGEAAPTALSPMDEQLLKEIVRIIEDNLDDSSFNVSVLARKIGMSIPVLYKKMKAIANMSVNDFIKSVKLQKAAALLQQGNMAVYEVCYAVGFQDRKHFSLEFKKKYGKTPKQYAQAD